MQDVQIAGSGLGDAIVGLLQGDPGKTQGRGRGRGLSAARVRRAGAAQLRAEQEGEAHLGIRRATRSGRVRYTVSVGTRVLSRATWIPPRTGSGRSACATGACMRRSRPATASGSAARAPRPSSAFIRPPPRVSAAVLSGRRCADQDRGLQPPRVAGPARSRISFGDGKRGRVHPLVHRYKRPGTYRVIVAARDRAGNRKRLKVKVRVR